MAAQAKQNPPPAYHRSRGEAEMTLAEDSYRKAQALLRRGDVKGSHDALIHAHRMAALAEADLLDGASPKAADAKRLEWWKSYKGLAADKRRNPRKVRNPYLHKFIPPGGKGYQYVYSEEDVAKRHAKKAQRIEQLKAKEEALKRGVKRDVAAGDPTALAVGLILATYERPGNNASAREGHFGVTGWECRHLTTTGRKATIDYIGKSGVHQTKEITDAYLVRALASRQSSCRRRGDRLIPTSASAVNRYLQSYEVNAKDLRTFGANTEMVRELTRLRSEGPSLRTLKPRDVKKTLKAEFNAALAVVAGKLGHTTSVLRKQYLVAGIEPAYLESGRIIKTFI